MVVWDFRESRQGSHLYLVNNAVSAQLLEAISDYLRDEGVDVELSQSAQLVLDREAQRKAVFNSFRDSATKFKDGRFDSLEFKKFQVFTESRIKRQLRPHQVKAAFHLYLAGHGANFSVPGSGKTSVVLTVYEKLRDEGKVGFLFVIGPPSCFGPWQQEFEETLGRTPNARILAGGDKDARKNEYYKLPTPTDELYLTTFQTLINDVSQIKTLFNLAGSKPFLVVDEAHYIKQQGGVWAKAVLEIAPLAEFRCVLTGTPMPNSFTDVFNLFDFLWGPDQILCSEDKTRILLAEERHDISKAKETMKQSIDPFFYRVRKKDLGLKEQVFYPPYMIPMNKTEKKLYSAIVTKIREYSQKDYLKNAEVVNRLCRGRMTRLRQCISYPKMLKSAIERYDESLIDPDSEILRWIVEYDALEKPAKLEFLVNLVRGFQERGEKVVIWSNFVATIDLISATLSASGFRNKCILGRTPMERPQCTAEETRALVPTCKRHNK
jgi:SNF2 family DNA or RNA helicase